RLLDGLIGGIGRQAERGADAGSDRWAEMRDVVDLVLMQADALHKIDLYLVASRQTLGELRAGKTAMLRHGQNRRDIVTRMRIVGGDEGVVEVEFAHDNAVGPGRPFRGDARG